MVIRRPSLPNSRAPIVRNPGASRVESHTLVEKDALKASVWQRVLLYEASVFIFKLLPDIQQGVLGKLPMPALRGRPIVCRHVLQQEGQEPLQTILALDHSVCLDQCMFLGMVQGELGGT